MLNKQYKVALGEDISWKDCAWFPPLYLLNLVHKSREPCSVLHLTGLLARFITLLNQGLTSVLTFQ